MNVCQLRIQSRFLWRVNVEPNEADVDYVSFNKEKELAKKIFS